ncbi:MAG: hypothetical protein ACR5LD_06200 [Symbiopectobacterium sp.]
MDINIVSMLALSLLVSLLPKIILLSRRFTTSIDVITYGLEDLAKNLNTRPRSLS